MKLLVEGIEFVDEFFCSDVVVVYSDELKLDRLTAYWHPYNSNEKVIDKDLQIMGVFKTHLVKNEKNKEAFILRVELFWVRETESFFFNRFGVLFKKSHIDKVDFAGLTKQVVITFTIIEPDKNVNRRLINNILLCAVESQNREIKYCKKKIKLLDTLAHKLGFENV